ncbi:MAG: DUF4340 domain-containing protein [Desulfobacterales bacterium]
MKLKKEIIVLAVVILALSVYLFTRQTDRTLYDLPQLPPVPAKAVTRIDIAGPAGTLSLDRADDGWTIGEQKFPADRAKVSKMLDVISDLSLTSLASESGDDVRYDLTDDKKVAVKAWAGAKPEREFAIGKVGPSFRHTFVKLAGDAKVYQARDNFRNTFAQSVEDLRDKSVFSFAASDVQRIELTKARQTLILVRHEAPLDEKTGDGKQDADASGDAAAALKAKMVWQTSDGRTADPAKIDQLLAAVSQLEAEKYIPDQVTTDFKDPIYTLELDGQKPHRLEIFAKKNDTDSSYPAVSSDSSYPFLLADWKAKQLMPAFEDLVKPSKDNRKQEK